MEMITLPDGGIQQLAKRFKISRRSVYNALRYKTDSNLAKVIRKAALDTPGARHFTETSKQ